MCSRVMCAQLKLQHYVLTVLKWFSTKHYLLHKDRNQYSSQDIIITRYNQQAFLMKHFLLISSNAYKNVKAELQQFTKLQDIYKIYKCYKLFNSYFLRQRICR